MVAVYRFKRDWIPLDLFSSYLSEFSWPNFWNVEAADLHPPVASPLTTRIRMSTSKNKTFFESVLQTGIFCYQIGPNLVMKKPFGNEFTK